MIYKTTYMLGSIKALSHANRCVWVTKSYRCVPAIPLPLRRLKDLPFFLYSAFKPETFSQIDKWHDKGGILVSQSQLKRIADERIGEHDAAFFVECPHSIDTFQRNILHTKGDIVIYCPPRWDEHQAIIDNYCMPIEIVKTAWEFLCTRKQGYKAIATDPELQEATGHPGDLVRLSLIRIQKTPKQYTIYPITLRYPPSDHFLARLYAFLEEQEPIDRGIRLIQDITIAKGYGARWRNPLKRLEKEGCISIGEKQYIFYPPKIVNWIKHDKYRLVTQGEFDAMRDLVLAAPLYPDLEILAGPPYEPI